MGYRMVWDELKERLHPDYDLTLEEAFELDPELGRDERNPDCPEEYEPLIFESPFSESEEEEEVQTESVGEKRGRSENDDEVKKRIKIDDDDDNQSSQAARMFIYPKPFLIEALHTRLETWTIKVQIADKTDIRHFKTKKGGDGCYFRLQLIDKHGTRIQATMWNVAARKFHPKLQSGKVYYISNGTIKTPKKKRYNTVPENEYEIILKVDSSVDEASKVETEMFVTKFNYVSIEELHTYVNGDEHIDLIGVVRDVTGVTPVKRKKDNVEVNKRDITLVDQSKKTVVVTLWEDMATGIGQDLHDTFNESQSSVVVVAFKSLKVGDFNGISLSATKASLVLINPHLSTEAETLKSWYDSDSDVKKTHMPSIGLDRLMYNDRVSLSQITEMGKDGDVDVTIKCYITSILPDQRMWYQACMTCNKVVRPFANNSYYCEDCKIYHKEWRLRYLMVAKVSDPTGEANLVSFNDSAENIIGCSALELKKLISEDYPAYLAKLKEATLSSRVFQVKVGQSENEGKKRQTLTVNRVVPIDPSAEARLLLKDIACNNTSSSALY